MMKIEKNLNTSGERLRRARMLAGITTRREFEKKYNISANTLQGWEQNKNPLSEKGSKRVIEAFKQEGLFCSIEWLMHGTGMPPRPYDMLQAGLTENGQIDNLLSETNLQEEENIFREIQLFKENNSNAITLNITDDAMEPYFHVGDYIGGVQVPNDKLTQFIGSMCIVELDNNVILARFLQAGANQNSYNVCSTNPTAASSPLNLYNVKIVRCAPVIWHRRKLCNLTNIEEK